VLQALSAEILERDSRRFRQLEVGLDQAARLLDRIATNLEERRQQFRTEPERTSQSSMQDRIAELKAAREVNDPVRVLVLYEEIAPLLEDTDRGSLQSEVAQWFLTAIYRRLRTGKIQVEVVELASRFANTFAGTTEGASVQAALPTLRRSAGLCPRCAQPYTGVAKACPECLRGPAQAADGLSPSNEPISPE
jgi:predicted amidophosphoribosyltransferase